MTKATIELCMGCMEPMGGQSICPHCGYNSAGGYDQNYIKPGAVLGSRYVVGRPVHHNGEGARYLGFDNHIQKKVWIQEYFPLTIAERGEETGNILALPGFGAQYKALMSDFVDVCNEVKRLSITESVVPIDDVVFENNTVYAIYRHLDLVPLESWLEKRGGKLPYDHAMDLFVPLLNTVSNIHAHGAIHRGISPYTVYVDRLEQLYLWDFTLSAARTANSELTAELFSGYSAPEQYSSSGWQGSWTDVYAVAALFYRTVSGVVPPKSTLIGPGRLVVPLEDLVMGLPKNVSTAVAGAMKPLTEERTQAVATLSSQLTQSGGLTRTAVYDTNKVQQANRNTPPPKKGSGRAQPEEESSGGTGKYVAIGLFLTVAVLVGAIVVFMSVFYPNLMGLPDSAGEEASEGDEPGDNPDEDSKSVPLFVGMRADEIVNDEQYKGRFDFVLQQEFNEDYDEGVVYDQSPVRGEEMLEKGTVFLFVSKGPEVVELPDLTGLTLEEATEVLFRLNADLKFDVFDRYDSTVEAGCVISTVPAAGEEIDPKRQTIYLFVVPEQSTVQSTPSSRPEQSEESSKPFFWYPD